MDVEYDTQVILLAVRNPLDVAVSYFQMVASQSHSVSIYEPINQYPVNLWWDDFFASDVKMWLEWHEYWMEKVKTSSIPIFFFRFEDLLLQPEHILKDMFKFILAEKDLDNTIIEKRI